jgi:hypothetical protein
VERHERLGEALDIIQGLLAGKITSYRGRHLQLDHAKLFDHPRASPPSLSRQVAPKRHALRPKGRWPGGYRGQKEIIQSWRKAGGKGPVYAEIALCCAGMKAAIKTARNISVGRWPVGLCLPNCLTRKRSRRLKHISVETIAEEISCGPSADRHLKAVAEYVALGCDHIVLNQIGPDQDFFFKFFAEKLSLPSARGVDDARLAASVTSRRPMVRERSFRRMNMICSGDHHCQWRRLRYAWQFLAGPRPDVIGLASSRR